LLQKYELKLSAAGNTKTYVNETDRIIRAFVDQGGWKTAKDINADDVTALLAKLRSDGRKPRTIQKYIRAVKGFARWLDQNGKLPGNPLASIKAPTPGKGNRRMLLPDEWSDLEKATTAAERYGMSGAERSVLYRVVAAAGSTKNRKRAQQYLTENLAAALRSHVATKTPTSPLFNLPSKWQMADILREDLAAARKTWLAEVHRDPDETLAREQTDFLCDTNHAAQVLDFHALRHTCGAWLVLAGVALNVVQKVMRHSTITLTIDTYGHILPGAEADAVCGLADLFVSPEFQPFAALKTGTDDRPVKESARKTAADTQVARR
jgi:site-specific recombinase XerD